MQSQYLSEIKNIWQDFNKQAKNFTKNLKNNWVVVPVELRLFPFVLFFHMYITKNPLDQKKSKKALSN